MSDPRLTNVSRAVRYRDAENCRTWAKEARNEAERKDFLDMVAHQRPCQRRIRQRSHRRWPDPELPGS